MCSRRELDKHIKEKVLCSCQALERCKSRVAAIRDWKNQEGFLPRNSSEHLLY